MSSKFISTPLWAPLATLIIRAPFLIILFLSNKFERITYTDAINILERSKPNKKKKFKYPIEWGVDLQSEHEKFLVEKHFKKPGISKRSLFKVFRF